MKRILLTMILVMTAGAVLADDVMDWVNDGIEAYKKKDYTEAVTNFEYAAQLIRQMKGEEMTAALPEALSGWERLSTDSAAAGAAMFGGGTSASANYAKGSASCDITITTDNPMLSSILMMFTNPMILSSSGKKLIKIEGEKASLEYNDGYGEITVVVAKRVLVQVTGNDITEEDLRAYAAAIDYALIEKLSDN